MHKLISALILALLLPVAHATVVGEAVDYSSGDTVMKGYLAYDNELVGQRPGILVVHEWWGHNSYARKRAEQLAHMGYVALAVDMYGDGKQAAHPKDAGKFSAAIKQNMPLAEARFTAALERLKQHPNVNPLQTGAIGYCFGGGIVLEMVRRGVPLNAVASFHGSLTTDSPAQKGKIKTRIFVANGADDPFVKPEHIEAFKQEMNSALVSFSFRNYAGAKHSFTNPDADDFGKQFNLPLAYNKEADEQSWSTLDRFLRLVFGSR